MQILFLLLLSFSFALELRNGSNTREEQIISFPWRVSISFEGFHFCSGAVISDTLVLTAASCLAIFDEGTALDIELGDGQRTTSDETIVHPDFNSTNLYADLGIICLPKPFQVDYFWHFSTFSSLSYGWLISLPFSPHNSLRLLLWIFPCQARAYRRETQSVWTPSKLPCSVFKFSLPPSALLSTKTSLTV